MDTGGGSRFAPLMQTDGLAQQVLFLRHPFCCLICILYLILHFHLHAGSLWTDDLVLNSRNITITKERVFQL